MASKTVKPSRVRAVPDFGKLHNKWEQKLQTGKACDKKPCTVVHEFDLTQGGAKTERVHTRTISGKKYGETCSEKFHEDKQALRSIINNNGVSDRNLTGRATLMGSKSTSKPKLRQSEYSKNTSTKENSALKSRLPTKSIKRKAACSPEQKEEFTFVKDERALQSIVNEKGISQDDMVSQYRPSQQNYTKTPAKALARATEGVRESLYSRVLISMPVTSARKTLSQKPGRVLATPAQKLHMYKNGEAKDPIKKILSFEADVEPTNNGTSKLKELEERERQLQEQIANLEYMKQERKRLKTDSIPSDSTPHTTNLTMSSSGDKNNSRMKLIKQCEGKVQAEIERLEKSKQERAKPRSPEEENPLPSTPQLPRNPFQELSRSEISKRSLNLPVDSDSECEESCGSGSNSDGCQKYPQSPLAKDSMCKVVRPNAVSHSPASKVQTLPPSSKKTTPKVRVQKRENALANRSPRCRDLWSPNHGRVEKSPRHAPKLRLKGETSPHSPKASWMKEGPGSPLFTKIMSKVSEQIKKAPLSTAIVNRVCTIELGMDKENKSPAVPLLADPSPKVYRYTDSDPMVKDVLNRSIDKLNQSIADITYQFEELENEAQLLGETSVHDDPDAVDKDSILSQLRLIKQKQEELIKIERKLQKQLFRQKYGSSKTKCSVEPKSAKKRLQMVQENKIHSVMEETDVLQSVTVPEITEKTSRLGINCEEDKNEHTALQKHAAPQVKAVDNNDLDMTYQNVLPTPPLPPRNKLARIVSPEARRPKPATPKVMSEHVTYSPQPLMTGAAQLLRFASPAAPIQTPLVLRTAALAAKQTTENSLPLQNSPMDLSVKNGSNSSSGSANSSMFSPDVTFSYLDEKQTTAIEVQPNEEITTGKFEPSRLNLHISDVQTTPVKSSTKMTDTVTTAMSRNAVTLSSDTLLLSSKVSVSCSPAKLPHQPGSLSLLGNMKFGCTTMAGSVFRSHVLSGTAQKYYDALADEEVALFMDRLFPKKIVHVAMAEMTCMNPLASVLEYGDDMHFVPIREETESAFPPLKGSAFSTYAMV